MIAKLKKLLVTQGRLFLLFAGDDYYPNGGVLDLIGEYKTLNDAIAAHDPTKFDYDGGWAHIYDTSTKSIVWRFNK